MCSSVVCAFVVLSSIWFKYRCTVHMWCSPFPPKLPHGLQPHRRMLVLKEGEILIVTPWKAFSFEVDQPFGREDFVIPP